MEEGLFWSRGGGDQKGPVATERKRYFPLLQKWACGVKTGIYVVNFIGARGVFLFFFVTIYWKLYVSVVVVPFFHLAVSTQFGVGDPKQGQIVFFWAKTLLNSNCLKSGWAL